MKKFMVLLATISFAVSAFAAGPRETKGRENKETIKAAGEAGAKMETQKAESSLIAAVDQTLARYDIKDVDAKIILESISKMEAYKNDYAKFEKQLLSMSQSSVDVEQRMFRSVIALVAKAHKFGLETKAGASLLTLVNNVGELVKLEGDAGQRASSVLLSLAFAIREAKNPNELNGGKKASEISQFEVKSNEELVEKAADMAIDFVYKGQEAKDKKAEFKRECMGLKG